MNRRLNLLSTAAFAAIYVLSCVLLVGLDQWTKSLAVTRLKGNESVPIIPNVFSLTYVENQGAAFGILEGRQWLLTSISVFFLALIFLFTIHLYRTIRLIKSGNSADSDGVQMHAGRAGIGKFYFLIVCMILITSGAVGNLIDRIRQGYVVDFLYVLTKNIPVISFDFPVFNVADCYVTIAAFSVVITAIFFLNEEETSMIFSRRR